ncbi:FHA domain-containing protein [Mycolicibacterium llatzerense]|uniref:FHA domain-containing protein n=2 Tax=Mycolicibacterium llatzerense TaxID=280871 RepID=UPI0031D21B41
MQDSGAIDGPDLVVTIEGRTSVRHAVDGAFTIGREEPQSDLSITHPAVSRAHARLVPRPHQWYLVDYESRNGIYLDGVRVKHSTAITDGMTVHLANPTGIAVNFRYVRPEDITVPALSAPATGDVAAEEPEVTRYSQATAELEEVIRDVMAVPAPGQPRFTRTTMRLLQRLGYLRGEFTELARGDDLREARAFLTCVEAMYDALLIRMSLCS